MNFLILIDSLILISFSPKTKLNFYIHKLVLSVIKLSVLSAIKLRAVKSIEF